MNAYRSGFSTNERVMFSATEDEFLHALPGWRLPLREPQLIDRTNPFTGAPTRVTSFDPKPGAASSPPPPELPFDALPFFPGHEESHEVYLALDLALAREHVELDSSSALDLARARGLLSVVFPEGAWGVLCFVVPERLVNALARIGGDEVARELAEWNARLPHPLRDGGRVLEDLVALAASATATRRRLFLWDPYGP